MKKLTQSHNVRGFTLIELLIVLVIIGFLVATVAPKFLGVKGGADAMEKYNLALTGTTSASGIFQMLGSGSVTPSNPMVDGSNTLEDVLFTGEGVASTYRTQYGTLNITPLRNMVQVITEPVTGSSAGIYKIGASTVTIGTPADNREMHWVFTNTPSEEVAYLVDKYDSGTAFAAATANSTGMVRYSAAASGLHTLTLVVAK